MPKNATVNPPNRTVTFHIDVQVPLSHLNESFGEDFDAAEQELYDAALEILWSAPAFDGLSHEFIQEQWE